MKGKGNEGLSWIVKRRSHKKGTLVDMLIEIETLLV